MDEVRDFTGQSDNTEDEPKQQYRGHHRRDKEVGERVVLGLDEHKTEQAEHDA